MFKFVFFEVVGVGRVGLLFGILVGEVGGFEGKVSFVVFLFIVVILLVFKCRIELGFRKGV